MPEPRVEKPGPAAPIEKVRATTPEDSDSAPPIASPFHATAVEPAAPIAVAPSEHIFAPIEARPVEVKPQQQADSKRTPPPAVTPRPIPELPPVSLTLPPESGLELVETKSRAEPTTEPEPAQAGPRRVRPPKVAIAEEPLQIVETQRTQVPPAS
jgi:hypothetical protein